MASNVLEEGISKKELQPEESVPPEYKAAAENFLRTFYQTFDTNRTALGQLFVCRNFQKFRLYIIFIIFLSHSVSETGIKAYVRRRNLHGSGKDCAQIYSNNSGRGQDESLNMQNATLCALSLSLQSLPFQKVVHEISTYDMHVTVDNSLLIVVVGRLKAKE